MTISDSPIDAAPIAAQIRVFFAPAPPPPVPLVTWYFLQDHFIDDIYYPAGTQAMIRQTWLPTPNVDPVDAGAIALFTGAGPVVRGTIRTQFTNIPVNAPKFNWVQSPSGAWSLVG